MAAHAHVLVLFPHRGGLWSGKVAIGTESQPVRGLKALARTRRPLFPFLNLQSDAHLRSLWEIVRCEGVIGAA